MYKRQVSATFPTLSEIGLSFAYGLYAAFALLSLLFVARWVPETKGRELEDMDQLRLGRRGSADDVAADG